MDYIHVELDLCYFEQMSGKILKRQTKIHISIIFFVDLKVGENDGVNKGMKGGGAENLTNGFLNAGEAERKLGIQRRQAESWL